MRFFATCARGTEGALRRELAGMRIAGARGDRGGVWFEGPLELGMKACLHARTAMRVLLEVGDVEAPDAAALHRGVRALPWHEWLTARSTLAVRATVRDAPRLAHSGFAALKVKDAVVDALRERLGTRPDVAPEDPDVGIVLHLAGTRARLFLDLAGEPLHRRGYRVEMTDAPLKETLAAAVLALGGAGVDLPFVDPMAGSGTLPIEHALKARAIAPGLARRFGFERWPAHDGRARTAWERLKAEARAAQLPRAPSPIVCADSSQRALAAARRNAEAAGVAADISFELGDVRSLSPRWAAGTVSANPPYGERQMGPAAARPAARTPGPGGEALAAERERGELYRVMAKRLRGMRGWRVVLLSGDPQLARAMEVAPAVSHRLWNGPIEVRLLRYEIPR